MSTLRRNVQTTGSRRLLTAEEHSTRNRSAAARATPGRPSPRSAAADGRSRSAFASATSRRSLASVRTSRRGSVEARFPIDNGGSVYLIQILNSSGWKNRAKIHEI